MGGIAGLTPEVNGEFKVQLYPNPVQEKLTIRAEKEISNVRIMNVMGKTMNVQQVKIEENLYELNTGSLASGTYIVLMKIDDVWMNARVIKK